MTGKTALADQLFVLDLYDWYLKNKEKTHIKLRWIYRSMERTIPQKIHKWICQKMWNDHKILVDSNWLSGRGYKNHIRQEYLDIIKSYEEYFDKMGEYVLFIEGGTNPTGIYNDTKEIMERNGKIIERDEYNKKYIPNDENTIYIQVNDHLGKLKPERNFNKKETLDKHAEYMGSVRDFYGVSPIDIVQFNRDISSTYRNLKSIEFRPKSSDFKGSGDMYDNSDMALALFNPHIHKDLLNYLGYEIRKFREGPIGRFRGITVLKSSSGIDDIDIGSLFVGEVGRFEELPQYTLGFDYTNYTNLNNFKPETYRK